MMAIVPFDIEIVDYPHAESKACKMLAEALSNLSKEHGISQRRLAAHLGYATSVPLSHMASGRAPIPVDKAVVFADATGMNAKDFLLAVLEQRHPDVAFREVFGVE